MNAALPVPPGCARLSAVDVLNRECFCISLDQGALARALDSELGRPGLAKMVRERCPYLFASQPVFVSAVQVERMGEVVRAIEAVVALPAYGELVLATAPSMARLGTNGPHGVFFGYDFHLGSGHLGLIEINTNAGGAMLNAVLARAHRACCAAMGAMGAMEPTLASVAYFEQRMVEMFGREWHLAGRGRPLASIAIVDEAPEQQYLYPEFLLFQQLFERHGLRTVIADPAALEWRHGTLWHGDLAIDLVYNRLTDFYLEQVASAPLREAFVQQGVVLTPHPRAHALYADKRRLALFSNAAQLQALGVPEATQQILVEHVPRTEVVDATDAQRLWDARRGLFFKQVAGFGSRAAYRGDKLTKRVWQDILGGDYVAQAIVAPGQRTVGKQDAAKAMKFDLRAYTYDGAVQWVAARLYQGQTTNFRTPGGGFAPVYSTMDASGRTLQASVDAGSDAREHASYVFLLDEDRGVRAVPHALSVALARGETSNPGLAGQTLRLADWSVRLKDGEPDTVVSESYRQVCFDGHGRIDPAATKVAHHPIDAASVLDDAAWPTDDEREQIRALLFGTAESPALVTGPVVRGAP